MSKKAFDKIAAGLNEAIAIANGSADPATYKIHIPAEIDVKAIRKRLGLTQEEFGTRFGFGARVRDWEQGRTHPDAATRAFLLVIDREPQAVERASTATGSSSMKTKQPSSRPIATSAKRQPTGKTEIVEPTMIKTPGGEELVLLPRADYEALLAAASDASEDEADVAIYDARKSSPRRRQRRAPAA